MRDRGITLLETLVALALVSALSAACVSWTTVATRALVRDGSRFAWKAAAERTLDTVHRALLIEDTAIGAGPHHADRLRLEPDTVDVRTRVIQDVEDQPAVCRSLRLRRERDVIVIEYVDAVGDVLAKRPLLGEVSALETSAEDLGHGATLATLRIRHESGESVERSWRLTKESSR